VTAERRPLLVQSNIIIDDIWLADGTRFPATLGGAATYAAAGAALWYSPVAMVAGVGTDLDDVSDNKLRDFGFLSDGHLVRGRHTIQSRLVYRDDGTRTETPTHGRDYFASLQVTPADTPPSLLPAAGTYVFRDLEPPFWAAIRSGRSAFGTVLWELQDDAAYAHLWPDVKEILSLVDHFSLNRAEADRLFDHADPDEVIDRILDSGVETVLLRMGGEGALIASSNARLKVTPPPAPVVDVTGGGNSFCGGYLGAWLSSGGDIEQAARGAAAAAAHSLGQYGPGDPRERDKAIAWARQTKLTEWNKP
jgi:sugar/nucleoside kinase (ribokinase family)